MPEREFQRLMRMPHAILTTGKFGVSDDRKTARKFDLVSPSGVLKFKDQAKFSSYGAEMPTKNLLCRCSFPHKLDIFFSGGMWTVSHRATLVCRRPHEPTVMDMKGLAQVGKIMCGGRDILWQLELTKCYLRESHRRSRTDRPDFEQLAAFSVKSTRKAGAEVLAQNIRRSQNLFVLSRISIFCSLCNPWDRKSSRTNLTCTRITQYNKIESQTVWEGDQFECRLIQKVRDR